MILWDASPLDFSLPIFYLVETPLRMIRIVLLDQLEILADLWKNSEAGRGPWHGDLLEIKPQFVSEFTHREELVFI